MRYYQFLALSLAVATTGCHDSKAANKDNFAKALTAFFDKSCKMLSPGGMLGNDVFPKTVGGNTMEDPGTRG